MEEDDTFSTRLIREVELRLGHAYERLARCKEIGKEHPSATSWIYRAIETEIEIFNLQRLLDKYKTCRHP